MAGGCIMDMLPACVRQGYTGDVLILLGLIYGGYLTYNALLQFTRFMRNYVLSSTAHIRKLGEWAVVTGATDGIGKAYAEEFARCGLNVFLISRTQSKLDQCAAELAEKFPDREFRTLALDFSGGAEVYGPLQTVLPELDVGVLVNNVGMGYDYPMPYHEVSEDLAARMVNVNVLSMAMMTRIVLPGMVERHRGAIVNVGSASGLVPTPFLALYGGSKAFADFFTRAMEAEYAGKGVTFQSVMPFFVATKLAKIRRPRIDAPSPTTFVRSAIRTIGVSSRTQGYWVHSLIACLAYRNLPGFALTRLISNTNSNLRKVALRKKEKAATEKKAE
ncbi:very-long-chain 3-oxoacyl-CoA reductase-like [Sycon ciliatum]|uniref:very-long-chain 3-oxoacyl-CoA reductase-like n=1 Tax=Sycon ciliatum TaxID=27933 RepID=UPI0020A91780|eukprot:scpid93977/ scgid31484/ Estradiol 17-beta-dehydrogenase 12; 17-beta-hydroxysteroid dehydrogenase 12; 3-ketoacyl-CoA reductase